MAKDRAKEYAERSCIECGSVRLVRKDSTALRCQRCAARPALMQGHATRRAAMPVAVCRSCGQSFRHHPSERRRTYCSPACRRGPRFNITGRGSNWKRIRQEALQRQPFCLFCGPRDQRLQVHHIIPYRLTSDNGSANLVPLCLPHHRRVEAIFVAFERSVAEPMGRDDRDAWRIMLFGAARQVAHG